MILKPKKCVKMQLKKLPFVMTYVPDWHKTQKLCIKAVDDYADVFEYVAECFKSQEMCDKVVDAGHFVFYSILINLRYKKYVTKLFEKLFYGQMLSWWI